MKRVAFLALCLTACFLSSISSAAAQDTGAISFAVVGTDANSANSAVNSANSAAPDPSQVALAAAPAEAPQLPPAATAPAEVVSFNLPGEAKAAAPEPTALGPAQSATASANLPEDAAMFSGGSESLVARTVGHAEGTRSTNGGKNPGYYGHVDPGNSVWNRGTFSYQFGNGENLQPEEADQRQLSRIKGHYDRAVAPKAEQLGLKLSLEEKLNAIDLANQAPLAVTESGGFVERLAVAKREKKLESDKATLDARVWSFWDNKKGGWDAPGLRAYDDVSKEESIRRDQDRRMKAISDALQEYTQEQKPKQPIPSEPPKQAIAPPPLDRISSAGGG